MGEPGEVPDAASRGQIDLTLCISLRFSRVDSVARTDKTSTTTKSTKIFAIYLEMLLPPPPPTYSKVNRPGQGTVYYLHT